MDLQGADRNTKVGMNKRTTVSELGAIGYALAGFTFWVLADSSIKLVGQSGLPAYEMVAFLGLGMAVFLEAGWLCAASQGGCGPIA